MNPTFVPIKVEGFFQSDIGHPKNDGTPGSGLYSVPIKLSAAPPREWIDTFIEAFDGLEKYDSGHRQGIASISQNRLTLNGTTMEEIESSHQRTIQLAMERANTAYAELLMKRSAADTKKNAEAESHRKHVEELAKKIKW